MPGWKKERERLRRELEQAAAAFQKEKTGTDALRGRVELLRKQLQGGSELDVAGEKERRKELTAEKKRQNARYPFWPDASG